MEEPPSAEPLHAKDYLARWEDSFLKCDVESASVDADRAALRSAVASSDQYVRKLYASGRGDEGFVVPELSDDPYLGLIPVHDHLEAFACVKPTPKEAAVPKVFPLPEPHRKNPGASSVEPSDAFKLTYSLFSENLLSGLDWTGVFAAGGSVLACLQPLPSDCTTNRKRRRYMHDVGFPGSDVDLFLVGLTPEEGMAKVCEIYETVSDNCPFDVLCFRSAHAITMVSQYPYRHIQVVLRLYSSPSEVLNGFDVDSCSVGFDGDRAWVTQRAHLALVTQTNPIDMTRRSPTYEMRLAKYASRGFEVVVPGLDRRRIDPMLLEKPWKQVQGLGKLLLLEKLRTPEARFRYKEQQRSHQMQRLYTSSFARKFQFRSMMHNQYNAARMETVRAGADASDYSTVFLPWGPGYTAAKCARLMNAKDALLNNSFLNKGRKYKLHPCFIGSAEHVLKDCAPKDPPVPAGADPAELAGFVRGPVAFIEDDPGRQMIGSFHPVDDDEWGKGALFSAEAEELCYATAADDGAAVTKALNGGDVTPNTTDYCGRTPLHIAALGGCMSATKALLKAGADPFLPMADGRSVVHVAAAYGHTEILRLLIEHAKAGAEGDGAVAEKLAWRDWNFKMTALHFALLYGQVEAAKVLLGSGADPRGAWTIEEENYYGNPTKTPVPPLLIAASVFSWDPEAGHELVAALLAAGSSATLLDTRLQSLLHLAAATNNAPFLEALMKLSPEAGACLSVISVDRQTPLSLAVSVGSEACVKALLAAGSPPVVDQAMVDAARQRSAALLQSKGSGGTYDLRRLVRLELKEVTQPLDAAVSGLLQMDQATMGKAVEALALLDSAEAEAALGGQSEPKVAAEKKDPLGCLRLLLAAGAPVNEAKEDQSRRHGTSSKDPVTALDKVEAWLDPLRKAAAQKRAQVAGEELLERLGRAEPLLTVCPKTGLIPGLMTPSMRSLKQVEAAEAADEAEGGGGGGGGASAWVRSNLQVKAADEQARLLLRAAEHAEEARAALRADAAGAPGAEKEEEDEETPYRYSRNRSNFDGKLADTKAAVDFGESLRKVLEDAGAQRWHVVAGKPNPSAQQRMTEDEQQIRMLEHQMMSLRGPNNQPLNAIEELLRALDETPDDADSSPSAARPEDGVQYCQLGRGGGHIPDAEVPKYKRLFEACWNGDSAAVSELSQGGAAAAAAATDGGGDGGEATELPVWVTVREVISGLSPYMAATLAGHLSLAEELLAIAGRQYTPVPSKKPRSQGGGGGEDYTKVNNYSLVESMQAMQSMPSDYTDSDDCDDQDDEAYMSAAEDEESYEDDDEEEDEEVAGVGSVQSIMQDVVSTAAAARSQAAGVLDAAKGVALDAGTGKKAVNRCPPSALLEEECRIPVSLRPNLVPAAERAPEGFVERLIRVVVSSGPGGGEASVAELRKEFPKTFPGNSGPYGSSSQGVVELPRYVSVDPLRLAILEKDAAAVGRVLAAAARLEAASAAPQAEGDAQQSESLMMSVPRLIRRSQSGVSALQAAVLMDQPEIVGLLVAAGAVNFSAVLSSLEQWVPNKTRAFPPPRVPSLVKAAAVQGAPAVLEWAMRGGVKEALLKILTDPARKEDAEAALAVAALLPRVGEPIPRNHKHIKRASAAPSLPPWAARPPRARGGSSGLPHPLPGAREAADRLAPLLQRLEQRDLDGLNALDALVAAEDSEFLGTALSVAGRLGAQDQVEAALNHPEARSADEDGEDGGRGSNSSSSGPLRPLQAAAQLCNVPMLRLLLGAGADVAVPDPNRDRGWNLFTFLLASKQKEEKLLAAFHGAADAVAEARGQDALERLLTHAQGKQRITPLMVAQTYNSPAVIDAVLSRIPHQGPSAALSASSRFGRLPLHLAVHGGRPSAAEALLKAHRDINGEEGSLEDAPRAINTEDLMGCTPVDLAHTKLSHAAAKSLADAAKPGSSSRRYGYRHWERQGTHQEAAKRSPAAPEARCYSAVRTAHRSRDKNLRATAPFEAVAAERSLGAEAATKEAGSQQGSFVMMNSNSSNKAPAEEQHLRGGARYTKPQARAGEGSRMVVKRG